MSDKRYPDESLDRFSEYMRDRLDDHRIPVDDSCWDIIESRSKQKRSYFTLWIAGLIAAAVIAMIVFILFPQTDEHLEQELITHKEKKATPTLPTQGQDLLLVKEADTVNTISISTQARAKSVSSKQIIDKTTVAEDVLPDNEQEILPTDEPKEQTIEEETSKKSSIYPQEEKERRTPKNNHSRLQNTTVRKKNNSWLIAALVGTGGASVQFIDNPVYDMEPNDGQHNSHEPGYNPRPEPPYYELNNMKPEDYSDIDHAVPISAGITVRKNLTDRIALESGLVYTYLSSKLKTSGIIHHEGRLGLHYLGIPLNLVVTVWEQPKWNIYLSAGGMAEKGLRSIYKQDRFDKLELISTTEKSSINGVAWSINGSIGVSYRFTKDWSFYVEPKISYYFDTDQPVSIRTEHPTSFGLGGGIRFQF